MSSATAVGKRPVLLLAEFETSDAVIGAALRVRDAGYESWDVHTPYPVHGMDAAMGLSDSRLGWIVLCAGLTGLLAAVAMMQWMNGYDYPLVIGGKPPEAYASMVPIMFELTVLLAAFAATFGMLFLNRLPRHHHPLFYSERFEACSNDKFFISIEADDQQFDPSATREFLQGLEPSHVELVEEMV
jgi:ActD protein